MDVGTASRFLAVLASVAGPGSIALWSVRRSPRLASVRANALWLAALVAVVATGGSLWYSEGVGFIPCELCWWQRIAMYPLALVLPVAAFRGDAAIRPYARLVAAAGLVVSLWHVAVQRIPALSDATSCSTDAPCSAAYVNAFDIFTIPTMAACGFLAIIVLTSLPRQ